jgi:hypothetical protein
MRRALQRLELRLTKEIRAWRNQTLLLIGLAGLVQVGLHFWH